MAKQKESDFSFAKNNSRNDEKVGCIKLITLFIIKLRNIYYCFNISDLESKLVINIAKFKTSEIRVSKLKSVRKMQENLKELEV